MRRYGFTPASAFAWLAIAGACFAAGCGETATGDFEASGESGGSPIIAKTQPAQRPETPAVKTRESERGNGQPDVATPKAGSGRPNKAARAVAGAKQQPPDTAPQPPQGTAGSPDLLSREVQVLVKQRQFKVEGPQDAVRVSYDDIDLLKVLNMEPVTPDAPDLMPGWLKQLSGKRIRIRGFMYPPPLETGIEAFALARDNQICCFGKNPKIYDVFPVFLRDGVTTDYIANRPFDVVGVFHIRASVEDGKLQRLYEMDDAVVIDRQR